MGTANTSILSKKQSSMGEDSELSVPTEHGNDSKTSPEEPHFSDLKQKPKAKTPSFPKRQPRTRNDSEPLLHKADESYATQPSVLRHKAKGKTVISPLPSPKQSIGIYGNDVGSRLENSTSNGAPGLDSAAAVP